MTERITNVYYEAVASGWLPGISVKAGDKNGNVLYETSLGKASLKEGRDESFSSSTIARIASMTKLMTAVAAVKAVELGILDLDSDVRPTFPTMGKYGIITSFDDDKNVATFSDDSTPITLRMLLNHTSGHEYDWLNSFLGKWRASRNEIPWSGPTVEDKSTLPLIYQPGTNFSYGAGGDWAGKAVEIASGKTLEEFMREHIWIPLGIQDDVSFYPKTKANMKDRMADMSSLDEKGMPPAVPSEFDLLFGGTDYLGGAGLSSSCDAYYTFLSALFQRDSRLLKPESYTELFRPQLDEKLEQAFNDYLYSSPDRAAFLTLGIPASVRKQWSFAGMICLDGQEGRFQKGTTFWAGVPCMQWWMDHEAGTFGTTFCQIIPPMHPMILGFHEQFQRGVLEIAQKK